MRSVQLALLALLAVSCTDSKGEADADPAAEITEITEIGPALHARWGRILARAVNEDGWVDYAKIRGEFVDELTAYLDELARVRLPDSSGEHDRMAFWINAYNAVCVQTLLDHDLPSTVPHAKVLGANIFTEERYPIAGAVRSLDEIEHGILRVEFDEPRVHAALVCGASSCPRLRGKAYDGARLDEQLESQARHWINTGTDKNGERKNRLDREARVFHASMIFEWFQEDFGGDEAGVLAFITKHADEATREFLTEHSVEIEYLPYDWSLNSR